MQERIYYRIISNTQPRQKFHITSAHDFQRSIPVKLLHKKQDKSSLAYLSSMMQTENLLMNKAAPSETNFTTREATAFVTQKASSLPQTGKKSDTSKVQSKSIQKMDIPTETRKRLLKKQSALLNIVGEYDPGEQKKTDSKIMQETIYKARTYTMMPTTHTFLPSYKKRQNNLKMKEEFTNFIKRQDWKAELKDFQAKGKISNEPTSIECFNSHGKKHQENNVGNTGDLYRFLKTENTRMKRLKTQPPHQHYPQLSKRMTQILLKSELKVLPQPFDLTKVGKRRNYQLRTEL